MFRKIALSGIVILAAIAVFQPEQSNAKPITQEQDIFAIIRAVDGNDLTIEMVNSVMSRDAEHWIRPNDTMLGKIQPVKPGNTRVAVCVKWIRMPGAAKLIPFGKAFPHEGCLGQLHDYEGAAGIPIADIKKGTPVRVFLNGDLLLPR